jgi:hypothetical protein
MQIRVELLCMDDWQIAAAHYVSRLAADLASNNGWLAYIRVLAHASALAFWSGAICLGRGALWTFSVLSVSYVLQHYYNIVRSMHVEHIYNVTGRQQYGICSSPACMYKSSLTSSFIYIHTYMHATIQCHVCMHVCCCGVLTRSTAYSELEAGHRLQMAVSFLLLGDVKSALGSLLVCGCPLQ